MLSAAVIAQVTHTQMTQGAHQNGWVKDARGCPRKIRVSLNRIEYDMSLKRMLPKINTSLRRSVSNKHYLVIMEHGFQT